MVPGAGMEGTELALSLLSCSGGRDTRGPPEGLGSRGPKVTVGFSAPVGELCRRHCAC